MASANSLPLVKPDLPSIEDLLPELTEILSNGKLTNFGKYVTRFENKVSEYLGVETVTTSSGTQGLVFALQAAGLVPGSYVLLPSFTFMATAQAVLYAGGIPLFAECSEDLTISVEDLGYLLHGPKNIGAVLAVHMFGLPAQVEAIQQIVDVASSQRGREIPVIYDAAHAFGSTLNNRRIGSFGQAEVFSLSPTKSLVAVEGGLVASRNSGVIATVKGMRAYGIETNYNAKFPGLNGKMSELHALVGLHNLTHFPERLAERQAKARYFIEAIHRSTVFGTIDWPKNVIHAFKDFAILVPASRTLHRREVQQCLARQGIETRAYFSPPVHQQDFFRRFVDRPLPLTDAAAARVISLPFYSGITQSEMDRVVNTLVLAQESLNIRVDA